MCYTHAERRQSLHICKIMIQSFYFSYYTNHFRFELIQMLHHIDIGSYVLNFLSSLFVFCQLGNPLYFSRYFCTLWIVLQSCLEGT